MPRNNEVDRLKHEGLVAVIEYDEEPPNPRTEQENLSVFYCWHSRYTLGDKQPEERGRDWLLWLAQSFVKNLNPDKISDEHLNRLLEKHCVVRPLYLYDHGGITMSCGDFGDRWDSGQVGWAVVSRKAAFSNWSAKSWDELVKFSTWHVKEKKEVHSEITVREYAKKMIEMEVQEYATYLEGQVYDYRIIDAEGHELDKGQSIFGYQEVIDEAKGALEAMAKDLIEKGAHVSI